MIGPHVSAKSCSLLTAAASGSHLRSFQVISNVTSVHLLSRGCTLRNPWDKMSGLWWTLKAFMPPRFSDSLKPPFPVRDSASLLRSRHPSDGLVANRPNCQFPAIRTELYLFRWETLNASPAGFGEQTRRLCQFSSVTLKGSDLWIRSCN